MLLVKWLLTSEDITNYQCRDNKKEICYKLIEKGKVLLDKYFK